MNINIEIEDTTIFATFELDGSDLLTDDDRSVPVDPGDPATRMKEMEDSWVLKDMDTDELKKRIVEYIPSGYCLTLLRKLYDTQNDAPLERDRESWEKIMKEVNDYLQMYK